MSDVQHTAILDIGACSDLYIMYISTNHNERPDPHIISQTNVTNHDAAIVDHYALTDLWKKIAVWA
ncbi:hypothetical protein MY010_21280 [Escherichia coli]|nr:hypothetical protein RIMDOsaka138_39970 [Escherichia coli]BBU92165.1 hypothetical protein EIMP302_43030 [Escherichia coli]BDO70251.1 hypothetical protein TUM2798_19230 [Escherichia coli]BDO75038.1 hypothetical protein TUM2809_19160 [Escherichia coli]BDO78257.1 hypothetical protein TUM2826_04390 [Escherichia coli]